MVQGTTESAAPSSGHPGTDCDAPIRIQRQRSKGWKMPPNTVNVARPSKWGNPFRISPAFEGDGISVPAITAESAVSLYREWLERALSCWPSTYDALTELRGKNLACWCPLDRPCHADVLLELANAPRKDDPIT